MVRTPRKGALGKIFFGGCFRRRHVARRYVIGVSQGLYGCPAYPHVLSWGIISRHKTIRFVRNYHGGDWAPYHEKWKKRLGLLEMAHAQGHAVVFPNRIGLRFRGRGLAKFIEMTRKRIDVNLCLAEQAVEVLPGALA